jgi:hypothetical protein
MREHVTLALARAFTGAAVAALFLAGTAGAAPPDVNAKKHGEVLPTSETSGYATYREQANDTTLLVDTYPASRSSESAYIPIPVAVGFFGHGATLRVSPASFVLVDSAGNRYDAAPYADIRKNYDRVRFDRELLKRRPLVVGLGFSGARRLRTNFYPAPGMLRIDTVALPSFSWFSDVIYFPRPAHLDGVLRVEFQPEGVETPMTARIAIASHRPRA